LARHLHWTSAVKQPLPSRSEPLTSALWLYQPIAFWLCFLFWLLDGSRLHEQLCGIQQLLFGLPQVTLTLRNLEGQQGSLRYEVSIAGSDRSAPRQLSQPQPTPALHAALPAPAAGSAGWEWIEIRVAARDADGCIRYGGEHVVSLPATTDWQGWQTWPAIEVAMHRLPTALCL
jgi:hypothetical protein